MEDAPRRERRRYVGFRVAVDDGPAPDRKAMVEAMDRASRAAGLPGRRRLTVFTGDLGIAVCEHLELETMLRAMGSIDEVGGLPARVETLVTSGTIKKVKAHLGLDPRA
jgi:RNase P/RNase MRP subunit POP5